MVDRGVWRSKQNKMHSLPMCSRLNFGTKWQRRHHFSELAANSASRIASCGMFGKSTSRRHSLLDVQNFGLRPCGYVFDSCLKLRPSLNRGTWLTSRSPRRLPTSSYPNRPKPWRPRSFRRIQYWGRSTEICPKSRIQVSHHACI